MTGILVNVADGKRTVLAGNLRRLRRTRALSTAELARRAGISRATLTSLETGDGNPTLDTLYGLANALDAALAELIAEPPTPAAPRIVRAGHGAHVRGAAVEAWLLDTVAGASTEIYDFRLHSGSVQRSAGHPDGTREHLYVFAGQMQVGPVGQAGEVAPGDFVTFDAGTEHVYRRMGRGAVRGLLVITHADR